MQILLCRHAGWIGRFASLDVLVNEQKVCSIERNETKAITLPKDGGTLRVEMRSAVSSTSVHIGPGSDGFVFECGSAWWVPFDIFSLCYLTGNSRFECFRQFAGCSVAMGWMLGERLFQYSSDGWRQIGP